MKLQTSLYPYPLPFILKSTVEDTNSHKFEKFKIQLNTLDETLELFKQTIENINDVNVDIDPDYRLNYQPLEMIDTLYCHIKEAAKILDNHQVSQNRQTADEPAVARLKKLEVPEFNGDPKRWPMFFETFKSLVHNNSNLNNTTKMHYLAGALKGRALDVCASVVPTPENYVVFWETLVSKYQDDRLLADIYFSQMLDFKTAHQESAACLNNFLEKFDTSVNAIKHLNIPDLLDFFIASLALSKLDSQTRKLFEMSKHSEIPTYKEIIDFVKNQRKALSSLSKNNQTSFNLSLDIASSSQSPIDEHINPPNNFCSTSSNKITQDYTTLLSTAVVNIMSVSGEYKTARFLIDTGSQAHFITTKCCQRLKLPYQKYRSTVNGIGGHQNILGYVNLVLSSRFDSSIQYPIYALVIDKVTDRLPTTKIPVKSLSYLRHIQLADEQFYEPSKIDGIIGASLFLHILGNSKVVGPPNLPMAVQTSLGYIVMGNVPTPTIMEVANSQTFCSIIKPSLEQILHKFWEIEEIPAPPVLNQEDAECENIFITTTTREETGRFTVALPFKEYPPVTIKQLASDEADKFPFASKVVETDLYIDDLVVSVPAVPEAIELYHQLVRLFSAGGFELIWFNTVHFINLKLDAPAESA
ncbi:hypothetical protein NQ314_002888 [Rhamnusium bicolor]|uniref:Peptidase A2 domain-containing protein n=1 Tax=Rhamnusium bicolor TaxID=1586634 RepID=A0AAV8ZQ20_9CUCU|nr:hypothetical protein NQ314_002888 [Rhamnusium bicolor]